MNGQHTGIKEFEKILKEKRRTLKKITSEHTRALNEKIQLSKHIRSQKKVLRGMKKEEEAYIKK